jgi:hypothetical protein
LPSTTTLLFLGWVSEPTAKAIVTSEASPNVYLYCTTSTCWLPSSTTSAFIEAASPSSEQIPASLLRNVTLCAAAASTPMLHSSVAAWPSGLQMESK